MGFTHHDGVSVNNLVVNTKATVPAPAANTDATTKLYVDTKVPTPLASDSGKFLYSGVGGSYSWQNAPVLLRASLTHAQMIALKATPVQLIVAPGAGKIMVLHKIILDFNRTASYTNAGGGDITIQQNAVDLLTPAQITPFFIAGASAVTQKNPLDAVVLSNNPIIITKATAELGAGNAANTMDIYFLVSFITQTH